MANYLDLPGLTHFKTKQDTANEAKFVKKTDFESTINDKLTNVYRYKGTKPSYEQLPQSGNTPGDVWDVAGGMNYAWDGDKWDALGESKVEITIDSEMKSDSENPVQNKVIYAALQGKASTDDAKKVTQTASTDSAEYPILTKTAADGTTATDTAKFAAGVTVNPSTGTVTATTFKGALDGKATSAAKADSADTAKSADSAKTLSATLGVDKGGTGATTAEDAWRALGGGSVGKLNTGESTTTFLRNDGTWGTPENTTYGAISDGEIDGLFA